VEVGLVIEGYYNSSSYIMWPGNTNQTDVNVYNAPSDSAIRVTFEIELAIVIICEIIAGVGILFCLVFMILIIVYRNHKIFISARVIFLIIIDVAGIMSYITVFLSSQTIYMSNAICSASNWLVHVSLILAMSCIIAKAFRVWRIFSNSKQLKVVTILDSELLGSIGIFMSVIVAYLAVWTVLDPYKVQYIPDLNENIQYVLCSNTFISFPIIIYILEAVIVAFSIFLAYKTRTVELLQYNESRYIALCVYSLGFTGSISIPISYLIQNTQANARYLIYSVCVLINTTAIIGFLFIPKIYFVNRKSKDGDGSTTGEDETVTMSNVKLEPSRSRSFKLTKLSGTTSRDT